MTTATAVQNVCNSYDIGDLKRKLHIPRLTFERDRWSQFSRISRDELKATFEGKPNLVKEISDPRFGSDTIVLMKKATLENMYRLLQDLESGQVALKKNYEAMSSMTIGLSQLVNNSPLLAYEETGLKHFVQTLHSLVVEADGQFVSVSPKITYSPAALSNEELQEIDPEDRAHVPDAN